MMIAKCITLPPNHVSPPPGLCRLFRSNFFPNALNTLFTKHGLYSHNYIFKCHFRMYMLTIILLFARNYCYVTNNPCPVIKYFNNALPSLQSVTNKQIHSKNTGTMQDLNLEHLDERPIPKLQGSVYIENIVQNIGRKE